MHAQMESLHTDHANIRKILTVLSTELENFSNNQQTDFYLMLDVIDYLENYPDLIHHPKEDIIFAALSNKTGEPYADIDTLSMQHQSLPAMTQSIRHVIENILDNAYLSREDVTQQIQDFIVKQHQHIKTEETTIFPLISETLDDEDWEKIESSLPFNEDPLFGNRLHERYQNLFNYLETFAQKG